MAIITLPAGLLFGAGCGVGQRCYDMATASDATGAAQARTFGPPRWRLSLVSPEKLRPTEAALWEQVLISLRGRVNHLAAHDPGKPAPLGTARGTLTLSAAAAIGATSLQIAGATESTNLLRYPQAFDNAYWSKGAMQAFGSGSVANAAPAPDGTLTADLLTEGTANAQHTVAKGNLSVVAGEPYTYSVYLKSAGRTKGLFATSTTGFGGANAGFSSFDTATLSATPYSGTSGGIIDVGGGWARLAFTAIATATVSTEQFSFKFRDASGGLTYTGDGVSGMYVWGARVDPADTAPAHALATLLPGDWLQLGSGLGTSQLVKVAAPATADAGTDILTVAIEPPLRKAYAAGTAVTWDKPLGYYKLAGQAGQWSYGAGNLQSGFALDLLEQWA